LLELIEGDNDLRLELPIDLVPVRNLEGQEIVADEIDRHPLVPRGRD
jgi:hypothetical protein